MKQNKIIAGLLKNAADMIDNLQNENEQLKKEASESASDMPIVESLMKLANISETSVRKLASSDQGLLELCSAIHSNYIAEEIGEESEETIFFNKNANVLNNKVQKSTDWANFDEKAYFESLLEEL